MEPRPATRDETIEVIRVLLLVQLGLLITSVFEAVLFTAVLGPIAAGGVVLAVVAAALVAIGRAFVGGSRIARRVLMAVQLLVLATAMLDVLLSLVLTGQYPPLVTGLTQAILPAAIFVLLLRPEVRLARAGGAA